MAEKKKTTKKKEIGSSIECKDRLCPFHGDKKLKLRGRVFQGNIIRKFHGRVTIEFERTKKVSKYERYEKRKTKLHARLPNCMEEKISIGDLIQIEETRPISKTIHFVTTKKIENGE